MARLRLSRPVLAFPPNKDRSALPIIEFDPDRVRQGGRLRLRTGSRARAAADCSFGKFVDHLHFGAWSFFHAAVKTELARSFTRRYVDRHARLLWGQHEQFFVWNTPNLRRIDRSVFDFEAFAAGSRANRFGEAVAHLAMVRRGYVYWDRVSALYERAMQRARISHAERLKRAHAIASALKRGRPDLEPDFAMESKAGDVVLMESKGSFVDPRRDAPTVRRDLNHALDQLAAWSTVIRPKPSKSFAIGTYFRDQSDSSDPSLIAFVDPPNESPGELSGPEWPEDWIRRGHYGAWLAGMGFEAAGNALSTGLVSDVAGAKLTVVNVAGRRFAVVPMGLVHDGTRHPRWPPPSYLLYAALLRWEDWPIRLMTELGFSAEVLGLDVVVLRQIENALRLKGRLAGPEPDAEIRSADDRGFQSPAGFYGSVMPDGSLYGLLRPEQLEAGEEESFAL